MNTLLRWREPAVVVVLAVLALRLGLALGLAIASLAGSGAATGLAAYVAAGQLGEPLLVTVLVVLLASCHRRPTTPHVRLLTVLGLVGAAAAVVAALVLGVARPAAGGLGSLPTPLAQLDVAERLLGLVVPALGVLALVALARGSVASVQRAGAQARPAEVQVGRPQEVEPAPEQQPTWPSDVAAGAAWQSAGDAASGRPASGWGTPTGSGWDPAAGPAAPTLPQSPAGEDPHPWVSRPQ